MEATKEYRGVKKGCVITVFNPNHTYCLTETGYQAAKAESKAPDGELHTGLLGNQGGVQILFHEDPVAYLRSPVWNLWGGS